MPSLRARLAHLTSRLLVKRVLDRPTFDLRAVRRAMGTRRLLPGFHPRDVRVVPAAEGPLTGEWLRPPQAPEDRALLYLHGGGYVAGAPRTHRALTTWLAHTAGVDVLALRYGLAPERPFPQGLDDAVAAVRALRAQGRRVLVGGDSAGAGLALATALRLRDAGEAVPEGMLLLCPLTDLTWASPSLRRNAASEPLLSLRHRDHTMRLYAGDTPLEHPYLSPVYADQRGLPPAYVEASRIEVLWDDAQRWVAAARAAGVPVEFHAVDDLAHDWQLLVPITPEANASMARMGAWVRARFR